MTRIKIWRKGKLPDLSTTLISRFTDFKSQFKEKQFQKLKGRRIFTSSSKERVIHHNLKTTDHEKLKVHFRNRADPDDPIFKPVGGSALADQP